ncbi:hypothetical protein E8E14_003143 [Neopestalotiopsis sp. 37M]|nr:hypothetical protein E8E14_003143 [Neopestalotiopsis sp. 37M]
MAAQARLQAYFDEEARYKYIKALGGGAWGITAKLAEENENQEHVRNLAVKALLNPTEELAADLRIEFRVVDRFEKPYDTGDVDWKGEKIFGLEPLVIMEFVANGDLERLIHRMIDPLDFIEKRLPDRVLWRIFMDLARAVELMDQKNRSMVPPDTPTPAPQGTTPKAASAPPASAPPSVIPGSAPGGPAGPSSFTSIPLTPPHQGHPTANKLVHFDIKPANVLCGDATPDRVPSVPQIKLADFGLAQFIDIDDDRRNGSGSRYYKAPEQTIWWDVSSHNPGTHTNIFCIALLMFTLITGRMIDVTAAEQDSRPRKGLVPILGKNIESFGSYLHPEHEKEAREAEQNFVDTDPSLRTLVAHCMAIEPTERPSVQELTVAVRNGLATANVKPNRRNPRPNYVPDEEIAALLNELFYSAPVEEAVEWFQPPPPPPPPPPPGSHGPESSYGSRDSLHYLSNQILLNQAASFAWSMSIQPD